LSTDLGRVADKSLIENRKETAHIDLSNSSTDVGKVGNRSRDRRRILAVKVGNAKDVNIAALWSAGGAERRLAFEVSGGSRGDGEETTEDQEGDE